MNGVAGESNWIKSVDDFAGALSSFGVLAVSVAEACAYSVG
jgi:hypothetical protein